MKSNEKYVFFKFTTSVGALLPKRKILFYLDMSGDLDHVIILTSSTQLVA